MIASSDLLTITVGRREYISPLSIDRLPFAPSRLAEIIAKIEAAMAPPGRQHTQLEERQ
jgi:hypothetical protein